MDNETLLNARKTNRIYTLFLCCIGLLINILGVRIALTFRLPLFLDNIGSALAAALGGYVPGIIVGFLTNLVNGIGDYTTTYYGSLTVLIAVFSAHFARKGWYEKPSRIPLIILTFALIGGGLGSILTWTLYGFSFGEGISAPLAHLIYDKNVLDLFWSQFTADMLIDVADKTITVLIVTFILKSLSPAVKERFYFKGWQQAPLSAETKVKVDTGGGRLFSLRLKIILLVALATMITALVVTTISFVHFRNSSIDEQVSMARGVVHVVSESFDHDRVDEYLEKGEAAEGYLESKALMKHLMDSSSNIEYCYVYRILEDGCHVVFDPDTEDTPGMAPGEIVGFDDAFKEYLPDLLAGRPIEPVVSNETYGWLLTIYEPVYDSHGVCQCYAAVDINMDQINISGYQFLARVISLFFGFFIMILTIAIWMAEYNVILPINSMAVTASKFSFDTEEAREKSIKSVEALDITTGDEIENLYDELVKSTHEMVKNIVHIQEQNEEINKLQSGLIMVLADIVESRDQCTGDHVRKTAAYTDIIMRELKKEGIYTDQLTDEFINDVVSMAPLHDVGKIQVPDAILNKPGKLTDDEFEAMKGHTRAGNEIINSAMNLIAEKDSAYLKEARNLAFYHHEKWNGMGYPCGLKGEEIPLSARIMAVADVFDALVSRRSYKNAFSFEKAMGIIQESSGTHFDPNVARAFLNASGEVYKVMQSHMYIYSSDPESEGKEAGAASEEKKAGAASEEKEAGAASEGKETASEAEETENQ